MRDVLTVLLLLLGCAFVAAGTLGLLRFPDRLSRLHALTKADNVGLGLIVAGLAIQSSPGTAAKLVLVWLLALAAASVAGPLLARDAPAQGRRPPGPDAEGVP